VITDPRAPPTRRLTGQYDPGAVDDADPVLLLVDAARRELAAGRGGVVVPYQLKQAVLQPDLGGLLGMVGD
jgi:hypothetical protein